LLLTFGCKLARNETVRADRKLSSLVEDARKAFDEGSLKEAEDKYTQALFRAWAMDDPYESGTAAYNLAACLTSQKRFDEALDWLADARTELCRARSSTGNTWLLSAEIATAQGCPDEAQRFIAKASKTCVPCELDEPYQLLGPTAECEIEKCRQCFWEKLPCCKKLFKRAKEPAQCQSAYEARIQLATAKLAVKQCNLSRAKQHYRLATEKLVHVCDLGLAADRHDVAALIFELEGNALQAGAHRDAEVELLRLAAQYREIPNVLDAAAESYLLADRFDLAADRLIRSARIHYARGGLEESWVRIREASELPIVLTCEVVQIRLALTAQFIAKSRSLAEPNSETPELVNYSNLKTETLSIDAMSSRSNDK